MIKQYTCISTQEKKQLEVVYKTYWYYNVELVDRLINWNSITLTFKIKKWNQQYTQCLQL